MGKKPLTPEQRKAKTEREKARRARLKAEKEGGSSTATPKSPKASKAKSPKGEPAAAPRGKEVDLGRVAPEKAKGMLLKVHKLEKAVEKAKGAFDKASQARRAARANLEKAQDALQREIQDQRFGPGPLFAEAGNPDVEEDDDGEGEREIA